MVGPLDNLKNVGINNINYISSNLGGRYCWRRFGRNNCIVSKLFERCGCNQCSSKLYVFFRQSVAADGVQTVKELETSVEPGLTP